MSVTFYQLLGHISLVVHTCDAEPGVKESLKKAGLSQDALSKGRKLAEQGEQLIGRRLREAYEDKALEHGLHASVEELEMWVQTVKYRMRKANVSSDVLDKAFDTSLHAHDHSVTAVMQVLRLMGMIRTDDAIHEAMGIGQSTHDVLVRGYTLLKKVYGFGQMLVSPGSASKNSAVFDAVKEHQKAMAAWLIELDKVAQNLKSEPTVAGMVGYVAPGIGLPLGGASFAVVLHEEARHTPPDPSNTWPSSGWSIGRQGRNRENLGKGFLEPTFE